MAAFRKYTHEEMVKEEEGINFLVRIVSMASFSSLVVCFICQLQHGDLRIHVKEAKDLPDTDNFAFNISRGDLTDPFVTIFLDQVGSLWTLQEFYMLPQYRWSC